MKRNTRLAHGEPLPAEAASEATLFESPLARWARGRFEVTKKRGRSPLEWTAPVLREAAEHLETAERWAALVLAFASLLLDCGVREHFLDEEARQLICRGMGSERL